MIDFLHIRERLLKNGVTEIYAEYDTYRDDGEAPEDLMIRGGKFYAIWDEKTGLWSTNTRRALSIIDHELYIYAQERKKTIEGPIKVKYLKQSGTKAVNEFYSYCEDQMSDTFVQLDGKLTFSNTETTREDYVSKRLPYPLQEGDISAYDKLMSVLYSPKERHKLEWAIGSIVAGDSINIQKFIVLYGPPRSGKSTFLNIIRDMFTCGKEKGRPIRYVDVFDAKALGSASNNFAFEAFHANPLIGIQHDGDLSKIEDNTRLNSLVSHETVLVNAKYQSPHPGTFNTFLFMGTNKPVKITDAKSGLLRRLIDVVPSGETIPTAEYDKLMRQIPFEYGAIAWHCREVYLADKHYYDNYIPSMMMGATNDFYNFMSDSYLTFTKKEGVTLNEVWTMYQLYCAEAKVPYPYSRLRVGEELKNYFTTFRERVTLPDGSRPRSYYSGFRKEKFEVQDEPEHIPQPTPKLVLDCDKSVFDDIFKHCPAQYATARKTPKMPWADVMTTLSDIDTKRLHYVKPPTNLICIDFDIKDEDGNKNLDKNLEKAATWYPTYSELSQSGQAVHLYYFYDGDITKLADIYEKDVEIKKFTGGSALRRKVISCNSLPIAHISSGLPLKQEDKKVIDTKGYKDEEKLRNQIEAVLNKEKIKYTAPGIDFIKHLLDEAYESGQKYNVQDLRPAIIYFATNSTHQAERCLNTVSKMHFCSEEEGTQVPYKDGKPIVFFDVEVYPNLFIVCWKQRGEHSVVRWINPSPLDICQLFEFKLIGFNNLNYDNYILYYASLGKTPLELYSLSKRIISNKSRDNLPFQARQLSYTDVYDFCSKKQSLKKWEIELGIHHKEMGIPWNKPVPEEKWDDVASYCENDVSATEAVFEARIEDFNARQILVAINKIFNPSSFRTVNDSTNSLSGDIIFGDNKHPQSEFNYRNLAERPEVGFTAVEAVAYALGESDKPEGKPYFPGYTFEAGKSIYRGYEIGEGGLVYANHGIYYNVDDKDVGGMHPASAINEELFGPTFTPRYKLLVDIRLAIKHKDYDFVRKAFNGALAPYVKDEESAKSLSGALKIVINSVYGLTSRKASDKTIGRGGVARFRDIRNVDNIVAKRGALFMQDLKWALETYFPDHPILHIKTDSVKYANRAPEVESFIHKFGEAYGYTFETEATFEKICLVNDAVFVAKLDNGNWTATGAQFQVPYVFKSIFTHEPITFDDMCETKSVSTAIYLDMNEGLPEGEHNYIFVGRVGQFTPVKSGTGGGELLRAIFDDDENITGYSAVVGTKGYRWVESEQLRALGKTDTVDESYYKKLVDEAIDTISKFGDADAFIGP